MIRGSKVVVLGGTHGIGLAVAELAPVRVNVVIPGLVETPLWSGMSVDSRAAMYEVTAAKLPVRHVGKPEEIAEHYLSFMRGTYVTGQSLVVDGGGVLV